MNMPNCDAIVIRHGERRDADTIVAFNQRLAEETEGRRLDATVAADGVRRVFDEPSRGVYYVAVLDGQVIGQTLITYEWSDWRAGWFWWIQSVYVHPEHRGRGVFTALFRHIESAARQRGEVCGLRLYVERENRPAIDTYARLGMVPSGHIVYEIDWSSAAGANSA
jgi:GNAT superfamily N-acetyltransferase